MKKIYFILVILLIFSGCLGKRETIPPKGNLDGFLDIVWENNLTYTEAKLNENGFRIRHSSKDSIMAEGKFIGKDVDLFLLFFNDRFYTVSVDFRGKNSLYEYNELNGLLIEKYGKPNINPKKNSDLLMTVWKFDNNCSITTTFFVDLNSVNVSYSNGVIYDEKEELKKNQNLNDL